MIDTKTYTFLADTEVYQDGEGYERVLLVIGWDPANERRIAKIHIRVDRVPGNSFALGSVWTTHGWVPFLSRNSVLFWSLMPGYTRWKQDHAESKTFGLAVEIVDRLRVVAESSDL